MAKFDLSLGEPTPGIPGFPFKRTTVGNDIAGDFTQAHAVVGQIVEHRVGQDGTGGWWADDTGTHGSRLFLIKSMRRSTAAEAQAAVLEGLQPLVGARKILGISASARRPLGSARLLVTANWSTPEGQQHDIRLSL